MTITLDDVIDLLQLPIRGRLLNHVKITRAKAVEWMVEHLGVNPYMATQDCDNTNGAHVKFSYLKEIYEENLRQAARAKRDAQAAGEPVDEDIFVQFHRGCVIRCFLMYLVGMSIFVDTSGHYNYVAYLRYFMVLSTIRDCNWGAAILT